MADIPTPHREVDLIMQGASQLGSGLSAFQDKQKAEAELNRKLHPGYQHMLRALLDRGYADIMERLQTDPSYSPQQAMLDIKNRATSVAPPQGAGQPAAPAQAAPPTAAPADGTPELLRQPPDVMQGDAGAMLNMTNDAVRELGGTPAQLPTSSPAQQQPSLAVPMGQARGFASGVMGGGSSAAQAGGTPSMGRLASRPDAPPSGPSLAPGASGGQSISQDWPEFTARDLRDAQALQGFLGQAQRPAIERFKAEAAKQRTLQQALFKQDLEEMKQNRQDIRMAARLESATALANARLDDAEAGRVHQMARHLLGLQAMLENTKMRMDAAMSRKEGDWKIQSLAIARAYASAQGSASAQLANAIASITDPKIQAEMYEAFTDWSVAKDNFFSQTNEIGVERGSPAHQNAGKPPEAQVAPLAAPAPGQPAPKKGKKKAKAGSSSSSTSTTTTAPPPGLTPEAKALLDEL